MFVLIIKHFKIKMENKKIIIIQISNDKDIKRIFKYNKKIYKEYSFFY